MKTSSFVLLISVFLVSSCTQEPVDLSSLQNRNGIYYEVNEVDPYNGKVLLKDTANGVSGEGQIKNGLREGEWVASFSNGQKESRGVYVDGQKDGTWSYWKENGEVDRDEIYKEGKRLGDFEDEHDGNESKETEEKPKPVNFKALVNIKIDGHYRKTLQGKPYTGYVVKYHSNGVAAIRGYYNKGIRSGTWTYYYKTGVVKDIKEF